jgi:hypothetical protein
MKLNIIYLSYLYFFILFISIILGIYLAIKNNNTTFNLTLSKITKFNKTIALLYLFYILFITILVKTDIFHNISLFKIIHCQPDNETPTASSSTTSASPSSPTPSSPASEAKQHVANFSASHNTATIVNGSNNTFTFTNNLNNNNPSTPSIASDSSSLKTERVSHDTASTETPQVKIVRSKTTITETASLIFGCSSSKLLSNSNLDKVQQFLLDHPNLFYNPNTNTPDYNKTSFDSNNSSSDSNDQNLAPARPIKHSRSMVDLTSQQLNNRLGLFSVSAKAKSSLSLPPVLEIEEEQLPKVKESNKTQNF